MCVSSQLRNMAAPRATWPPATGRSRLQVLIKSANTRLAFLLRLPNCWGRIRRRCALTVRGFKTSPLRMCPFRLIVFVCFDSVKIRFSLSTRLCDLIVWGVSCLSFEILSFFLFEIFIYYSIFYSNVEICIVFFS